MDDCLLSRFPDRAGSPSTDALEDASLRRGWTEMAEDWLASIEHCRQRFGCGWAVCGMRIGSNRD